MYLLYQGNGTKTSGPDLRRRVTRYLEPFSKRKKKREKTGDNIYLSIGDVSGPRQPKCHRSKQRERERERERDFFSIKRRKQLTASRARGIGLISEKEARIEIVSGAVFSRIVSRRDKARKSGRSRSSNEKGRNQILDAAVAALKGEPATTAAFRQDRKYAEFMDARVPPPPRSWDGFLRSTVFVCRPLLVNRLHICLLAVDGPGS